MDIQIGKVIHFYDKIGVAIVEVLNQKLKTGDRVKLSGHDKEFNQDIGSLQIEHSQVREVDPGETVGIKVDQPVKTGDVLYLLSHT
jgi:translation initiation factor IF-2